MLAASGSTADDARYTGVLAFGSMTSHDGDGHDDADTLPEPDPGTENHLGPMLVRALIPAHYRNRQDLARAVGAGWPTVDGWARGRQDPQWPKVEKIAGLLGMSGVDFVAREIAKVPRRAAENEPKVQDHPDYPAALAEAQRRYGNRMPSVGFSLAGSTSGAHVPEHIDAQFVYDLAQFWLKYLPDGELMAADTEDALAELQTQRRAKHPRP